MGGGHQSAANALAAAFESAQPGAVRVHVADLYLDHARFPVTRFPALYAWLAANHRHAWQAFFHATNAHVPRLDAPTLALRPFLMPRLKALISEMQPSIVVSVLPAVNGLLAAAVRSSRCGASVEVVLTDWYDVHQMWVSSGVSHYTAPTEPARQDLIRYGVDPSLIDVVGIPVRPEFASPTVDSDERARTLAELGLRPERFTVLAMVGAEGSPRALAHLQALLAEDLDAQIVVVCGRNERLKRRLEAVPTHGTVRVLGYTAAVAALMRSADLLVTKAGGVTLAEAFACGVPTVVYDALPGQEVGNKEFAVREGAIEFADADLFGVVRALRAAEPRRLHLAERARLLARPDAAPRIVRAMLARHERAQARAAAGI